MSAQEIKELHDQVVVRRIAEERMLGEYAHYEETLRLEGVLFAAIDAQAAEIERLKGCLFQAQNAAVGIAKGEARHATMYQWLRNSEKAFVYIVGRREALKDRDLDNAIRAAMKGGA